MTTENADWLAGAASAPFPVTPGTPLAGYVARNGPALGTLDDLTIGAMVLEQAKSRFVIVAADLIAVDAALVAEVAAATGLDRSQLALCASHTHSGPAGVVARLHPADTDRLDPALRARFVATAANAIAIAIGRLEPVNLLVGRAAAEGIAANRNDPGGLSDDTLTVLTTCRRDGSRQGVICHFACHPTILGADSRLVSADFPGALRRSLTAVLTRDGEAPVVLFVNGAAGDVSTRFTRRAQDAGEVERVGAALAEAAMDALGDARVLDGPIRHGRATVSLPHREPLRLANPPSPPNPPPKGYPAHCGGRGGTVLSSAAERRISDTRVQGAAMLAAFSALPAEVIPARLDLDAWTLGDLALVTIPGELFASLGRRIRVATSGQTLVLGYGCGYAGYLADRAAHEAGTYEALASPYAPQAGERVVEAAAALVRRLMEAGERGLQRLPSPPTPTPVEPGVGASGL